MPPAKPAGLRLQYLVGFVVHPLYKAPSLTAIIGQHEFMHISYH